MGKYPFDRAGRMKVYDRCAQGAEAGVLAGAGVAVLFLFLDVVHLTPLATPEALSAGFFTPSGYAYDTGLMAQAASLVATGLHLLTYTVLHFGTFAVLGVAASFLLRNAGWAGSLVGGMLFGLTVCTGVFWLSRDLVNTPVVMEAITVPSLLVANTIAGAILGAGIYLGRMPNPEEEGQAA